MIFQILSAILHFGNVRIKEAEGETSEIPVSILFLILTGILLLLILTEISLFLILTGISLFLILTEISLFLILTGISLFLIQNSCKY
jgi:hypothetical protein